MNILTTHLEKFNPEVWRTLVNTPFSDTIVRDAINFLKDGDEDKLPEADYALTLFQFKVIFENNTTLSEISNIVNPGTVAFLFIKALSMLRGSESEVQEAIEISKGVLKKTKDSSRHPYFFLISGIESGIFKETFGITQNRDTSKIICNTYLDDVISNNIDQLPQNQITDLLEFLGFSYRGTQDTFPDIFKEYIYENYIKNEDKFNEVLQNFYASENILIEILKKENADLLTNYMTKGSSATGIKELSLNFKNKDEVFEIIDQIDEKYINYYKGKYAIPKESALTDEDLEIYGAMLDMFEVIDNVTVDQAIKYKNLFTSMLIISHKYFTIDKLKDFEAGLNITDSVLEAKNYLQSDLINIAELLTIKQLKNAHCLITPELFYAVNDRAYDIKFIYESLEPLYIFIRNTIIKQNFNMEFISEIRNVYGCSTKDIFNQVTSINRYDKNMDDRTKKAFKALNKIINE
jgi:hypothetical protein